MDLFGRDMSALVPSLLITVSADPKPSTVANLKYLVPLRGIEPVDSINIVRTLSKS